MKLSDRRFTWLLLALTAIAVVVSLPGALRESLARGEIYLFSSRLFADLPARLAGPGRFRFLLQPLVSALLGVRDGRNDARGGRPPFLLALVARSGGRRELARSALATVANIFLMAILLDLVAQWLILGVAYPAAALIVGPLLVFVPYSLARAFANRLAPPGRRRRA